MQLASSNTEDVNLSQDELVDLNYQTEVNVKDVEGGIGDSPTKLSGNKSTIIPGILTQNAGTSLVDLTSDIGLAFLESNLSFKT